MSGTTMIVEKQPLLRSAKIEAVSNGWIVWDSPGGGYHATPLAVFNNIDDMSAWLKIEFVEKASVTC